MSEERNDKVVNHEEEKIDEDFDEDAALSDYSTNKGGSQTSMKHRGYYTSGNYTHLLLILTESM